MADPARFPQLALPFAFVGACAGWLSVRMLENPLIGLLHEGKAGLACLCALGFATVTGALLTRLCVGRRYAYQLGAPNPETRPSTDAWPIHVGVVLAAGAATGATVILLCDGYGGPPLGAFGGFFCALAFVPVCLAVIASARRAQRARLGSLVAGSDRRAVWGILALTLALATLEVIADWPAGGRTAPPFPALGMALVAAIVTAIVLAFDLGALARARHAERAACERQSPGDLQSSDPSVPRLDLGLGDDLLAAFKRSAAAYRGRDRMAALVEGSPALAVAALRRAARRGAIGLALIALIVGAHLAAGTGPARALYERLRCKQFPAWCSDLERGEIGSMRD